MGEAFGISKGRQVSGQFLSRTEWLGTITLTSQRVHFSHLLLILETMQRYSVQILHDRLTRLQEQHEA